MIADAAACEQVTTATLTEFRQVSPVSGAAPGRGTTLRISDDGKTLFIDIQATDPSPRDIVARQMKRDQQAMLAEDHVAVVIDVPGKGRDGLFFAVNANGAQFDGLIHDGGSLRSDWDALWQSSAAVGQDGWTAQLRIPLSVLGQQHQPTWRINAERWMPHGAERVRLAGWRADQQVQSLGDMVEIEPTSRRCDVRSTRLKASLRTTHLSSDTGQEDSTEWRVKPGLEIFHERPGGLRIAAAFNLDFGEAEADDRQIQLDRFELFRDEKRAFFLEDAGRFSFGGLDGHAVMPFYSRRIGLDDEGRVQEVQAAAKLSGRLAGLDFGLLATRLDAPRPEDPLQPSAGHEQVAVLRIARPLGARHTIGAIGTAGDPTGNTDNWLWGLDHHYLDTSWSGDRTLETRAWFMESRAASGRGDATASGASIDYPNLGPTGYAAIERIGRGFHPALGYLAEDNVLRSDGSAGWWTRTARGTDLTPAVDWYYRRSLDGAERTREINPELVIQTAAEDVLVLEWFHVRDELAAGYEPLPGVSIAPGRHGWNHYAVEIQTSAARLLSVTAAARTGGYYEGRRDELSLWLGWQPAASWGVNVGAERQLIQQPSGSGAAWMSSARLDFTPHTHFYASALLQWDSVSDEAGFSARLHWRHHERWDVFLAVDALGQPGESPWREPARLAGTLKFVVNL